MTKKVPPVPPENRSPKGPGDEKRAEVNDNAPAPEAKPDERGQSANTKKNTTHQGYQQDR